MEKGHRRSRSAEQIRQARATNRVFGLADAEKWSGCKQLMDFLDDTFCYQRKVSVKFQRPVRVSKACHIWKTDSS